ncbi:unnamed protein product [Triticum turgidum subsp. durum]|uniref:Uncharacterized protein n=1 Tax=Triticum turgidum subsp. durum TaxID=4567 RepID=A0A9R1A7P8_TRITD|nr:unnamed protein product [Triticum turgidum subsp. durum]
MWQNVLCACSYDLRYLSCSGTIYKQERKPRLLTVEPSSFSKCASRKDCKCSEFSRFVSTVCNSLARNRQESSTSRRIH